ncbi:MAG: hypothetical protein NC305_07710 [Lachnospiraceae bacterium]|nr:hypothetical protein [Butyrivibrio sp.]MCM1343095.1 hypothetical protein [Muribaculaceae bacterium]MCM1410416.1 hypothetical protein [Lachnospiraceae bacterium]
MPEQSVTRNEIQSRAWFLTLFEKNFENLKIPPEYWQNPEHYGELAAALINIWQTRPGRTAAVAVCSSAEGAFHVHMAVYSKTPVRFSTVHATMGFPHVEPQRGTKEQMFAYMTKTGKFEEKGEKILLTRGMENIQGKKPEDLLEEAHSLIVQGFTPREIFAENIKYRKYEKEIQSAYTDYRVSATAFQKDMKVFWHCGASGSGKTHVYYKLIEEHGEDDVYFYTDFNKGGLDKYAAQGLPPILFIDELRPDSLPYRDLLVMLDRNSRAQTHCRYGNVYNLWTEVHITSIYSPIDFYNALFLSQWDREKEPFDQLQRRLTEIIYHFKADDDIYDAMRFPPIRFPATKENLELLVRAEMCMKQQEYAALKASGTVATPPVADLLSDFGGMVPIGR